MQQFFSNKRLIILLSGIVILALLITLYFNTKTKGTSPDTSLDSLESLRSIENLQFIGKTIENIQSLNATYEENKLLRERMDNYDNLSVRERSLREENEELKGIIKKTKDVEKYNPIQAAVIDRSLDNWYERVAINKGKKDGVKPNMAVITANGLIGKVEQVKEDTSIIQLLSATERTNLVSASLKENTKVIGIVGGYDTKKNAILFSRLPQDQEIKIGDNVLTSGLGGVFPPNLEIGEVIEVNPDNYGLTQIAYLKPKTNLYHFNHVILLEMTNS